MSNHIKYKDELSSCGISSVTDAKNQSQPEAEYAVKQILPLINEESNQISSILNQLPTRFKNILTFGIEKLTAMANLTEVSQFLTKFKEYSKVLAPLLGYLVNQKTGNEKDIYKMVITVVEIAAEVRKPVRKPIEMA